MTTDLIFLPENDTHDALSPELLLLAEKTRAYILESLAPSTLRAYRSDWSIFVQWCLQHQQSALPTTPEILALFLSQQASASINTSTLSRRCAAIRYAHLMAGHPTPTQHTTVSATLKGIRRTHGRAPKRKTPTTAQKLRLMLQQCPHSLSGLRDKALLLLGFSGAFRRSELVALEIRDLDFTEEGLRVHVRRSKTDQEGQGAIVPILNGLQLKPVSALKAWLEAAEIKEGALFRPFTKNGRLRNIPLSDRSVANLIKRYAHLAGFEAENFSGHSLRSGFLTSAAESGASLFKMIEVSRHKNINMLQVYVRMAELFKDHAGSGFL